MPLFFLNLAHAYDHFFLLIFPTAVLALAPAWGMSYGEALALGTAAFVMFAAGTLPSGWLGDRWSRAHMMTIFFIGIGASAVLTGLAPGPVTLVAGLGLLGLFASIYHPVGTALVVQSAARSGRALGVNGVYGNMGVAGAALITGTLTQFFGWRAAFVIPGLLAVITGILFARMVGAAGFAPAEASAKAAPKVARPGQVRVFVVVGIGALLGGIVFHGTTISLPKVFEARLVDLADSVAMIGLLVSIVFAIAAFAQIAVGQLLDRFGARAVLPLIVAPQAIFLALAAQAWGWSALRGRDPDDAPGVRRDPDRRLADRPLHCGALAVAHLRPELRALARGERPGGAAARLAVRAHRQLRCGLPAVRGRCRGHRAQRLDAAQARRQRAASGSGRQRPKVRVQRSSRTVELRPYGCGRPRRRRALLRRRGV